MHQCDYNYCLFFNLTPKNNFFIVLLTVDSRGPTENHMEVGQWLASVLVCP